MADRIQAISLWQPWASLVFATMPGGHRVKVHETRHWVPSEHGVIKRGSRLAIHAALTRTGVRSMTPVLRSLCGVALGDDFERTMPFGAVLGTVTLADWYPAALCRSDSVRDTAAGHWGEGRFAWRLDAPERFALPIAMKGRQGFWSVELGGVPR